jgi:hypothetical protein
MENQLEMSSAVTTPWKLGRLEKSAIKVRIRRPLTMCTGFSMCFSEQHEQFSNINVHIK